MNPNLYKLSLRRVSPCSQQEIGASALSRSTTQQQWITGPLAPVVNITWFRALALSLLPFFSRPVFLPPSSWYLHHTADGSACLKNIYPFSLNVTDSLPSVHILYHQYGGGVVAQWLALSFHSNKVNFFVPVCSLMFTMCLCGFLPPFDEQSFRWIRGSDFPLYLISIFGSPCLPCEELRPGPWFLDSYSFWDSSR